ICESTPVPNVWIVSRTNRNAPSSTIVTATVPIAVNCMPALRVKFVRTSPRKNRSLPQSTEIVASLIVVENASVLQPYDAPAHPVDDGLVVGRDHDGRALEVDPLQQLHDLGRVRRIEIPGRLVAQQQFRVADQRARSRCAAAPRRRARSGTS